MTPTEIERMAREADFGSIDRLEDDDTYWEVWRSQLIRFAELVACECAKVCHLTRNPEPPFDPSRVHLDVANKMADKCAAAIRARFCVDSKGQGI